MRRIAAVVAALAMTVLSAGAMPSAHAATAPAPRPDEWWTSTWSIGQIWPTSEGQGVTVAVLDTGVNAALPELSGAVVPGADMTGRGSDGRTDSDISHDGHGTAMAALIAARGGGPTGFVGVAPRARVLPVTVTNGQTNSAKLAPAIGNGIHYAVDHGAKVISISQAFASGGDADLCPAAVLGAVQYAASHDVLIVAATGDAGGVGNSPNYPGSCPGVLAVGAIDKAHNPWPHTQQVDYVQIAAPGAPIGWLGKSGKYYPQGSGTSQATALAAGGLALVRAAHPEMSAREVAQRAIATANDLGTPPGFDNQTGYGAIRVRRVMDTSIAVPKTASNPAYARLDKLTGRSMTARTPVHRAAKKGSSTGVIVVVAVVLLLLAGVVIFLVLRRRSFTTTADDRRRDPTTPRR